jgi:hypothetical protein
MLIFGNQPIGSQSAARIVTLKNTGTAPLTVSKIALTGTNATSFVMTKTCGSTLAAGASCTINVSFKPAVVAADSAKVTVTDSAAGSPHSVTLTGSGVAKPVLKLTPASLIFASQTVGTQSAVQNITLTNTSTTTATTITSIAFKGTSAASYITTSTCGTTLAANTACTIHVSFKPKAVGPAPASLTITDNATGSPQNASLTGTGK